ncbi:MAG: multicopper oxidase domain-containing protein [Acidaminobacteraceae bacterium]
MKNKFVILTILLIAILIGVSIFTMSKGSAVIEVDNSDFKMLPIPALLEDTNPDPNVSDFFIDVKEGSLEFIKGRITPTLGYNGDYLGPVVKVSSGDLVNMHVNNKLSDSTSVHWHGLEVKGSVDGGPHQVIESGSLWEPTLMIDQPAATLWFHPHVIGTTATQVYYGLAGLIIVEDENSKALNLPDEYGVNDIPLIIQDRSFNSDGSFAYINTMISGAVGDNILVNGAIKPYLEVEQVKMRFRILNGANASNFNLTMSDNSEFYQIASDGGLFEEAIISDNLFVSPGERYEIIVDFSKYKNGDIIELRSYDELVMTFTVGDKTEDLSEIPKILSTIEKMDESLATSVKTIELNGTGHMVTLNGKKFDMNRIDDNVLLDDVEIWEITSSGGMMSGMGHPFHIHGTQFQILTRNGEEPRDVEGGWKDTVYVRTGETVRVIVKFKNEGVYMYHCHILEHEEDGMMGQLEVIK